MLATKVIVAPNSPMLRAKERIMPAMMPGRASGRVITRKTQTGPAPSVASTLQPPVDRLDRQPYCAHHQRKAHHRAGECGTGPAKGEHDPEMLVEELAERAAAAEQQQQVAGRHRRRD